MRINGRSVRFLYIDNVQNNHRVTLEEQAIKDRLLNLDYKSHVTGQSIRTKTKMHTCAYLTYTAMGDHQMVSEMCWPTADHATVLALVRCSTLYKGNLPSPDHTPRSLSRPATTECKMSEVCHSGKEPVQNCHV